MADADTADGPSEPQGRHVIYCGGLLPLPRDQKHEHES